MLQGEDGTKEVDRLNAVQQQQGNGGTVFYYKQAAIDCTVYAVSSSDECLGQSNGGEYRKRGMALMLIEDVIGLITQNPVQYLESGDSQGLARVLRQHVSVSRVFLADQRVGSLIDNYNFEAAYREVTDTPGVVIVHYSTHPLVIWAKEGKRGTDYESS
jgi:hypothetical protein